MWLQYLNVLKIPITLQQLPHCEILEIDETYNETKVIYSVETCWESINKRVSHAAKSCF